jgi:hypothetical protein
MCFAFEQGHASEHRFWRALAAANWLTFHEVASGPDEDVEARNASRRADLLAGRYESPFLVGIVSSSPFRAQRVRRSGPASSASRSCSDAAACACLLTPSASAWPRRSQTTLLGRAQSSPSSAMPTRASAITRLRPTHSQVRERGDCDQTRLPVARFSSLARRRLAWLTRRCSAGS